MIYEYALEPEMVAAWGEIHNYRYFLREFGIGQGRVVSRYPKKWAKKVWQSFNGSSQMERKRLEELLVRLQETMIKRKDFAWNNALESWQENALIEYARHPFWMILTRKNPNNRSEICCEDNLADPSCHGWDNPHGKTVDRDAQNMTAAVEMMLTCCRWVKFIDPYMSPGRPNYRKALLSFLNILGGKRPVGSPESVEVHTRLHDGTEDFLQKTYQKIIPIGMQISLFQWQERPGGQRLHNRYILTNLGGVSFHHGLDIGKSGETDDITRLASIQYQLRCRQYDITTSAFDQAAPMIVIKGTR